MSSPRRIIISLLSLLGLAFAVPYHEIYSYATATAKAYPACNVCDPCPTVTTQSPIWWSILSYTLSTCEVLLRSFTLGFGIRMLVYILWEYQQPPQAQSEVPGDSGGRIGTNILSDIHVRRNIQIAILTGVSTASAVFGSSLFIPASIRTKWFD